MKKIVIVCVAIVVAAVTQAASVNWTISNVYKPGSDEKIGVGSATAYLFLSQNTTGLDYKTTSLDAVKALLGKGDIAGAAGLSVASAKNTAVGGWGGATGLTGISSGSISAFAVVIDSSDPANAENYFIVSGGAEQSATFASATGSKMLIFADQTKFTQGAGAWTPAKGSGDVPEPTSGVLLLLGMAGLALRRKQK